MFQRDESSFAGCFSSQAVRSLSLEYLCYPYLLVVLIALPYLKQSFNQTLSLEETLQILTLENNKNSRPRADRTSENYWDTRSFPR